ncbi:MAG TPA: hypothetical protein VED17_08925 [Nitrososphaerales archaeon]|nr:hypothetical protein [Nitrososphaerales archaeon]
MDRHRTLVVAALQGPRKLNRGQRRRGAMNFLVTIISAGRDESSPTQGASRMRKTRITH